MPDEAQGHPLNDVPNFRDVADRVPALKPGMLFRSDVVVDPDDAAADAIAACGIRLVIDLRSPVERSQRPNRWFEGAGAEVIAFDVAAGGDTGRIAAALGSGAGAIGAHAMMIEAYRNFPAGALQVLRALGERVEAGDLPILVHCAAGKDRTGFTIAALLSAIGIDRDGVAADYLASAGRVHARTQAHTRAMMGRLGSELDEVALASIGGVHIDYLDSAFAEVTRAHGSLDAYWRAAGLAGARLECARARLLR
jgi:protein-tyrosine phosphatase